jgi:hypothetical protein
MLKQAQGLRDIVCVCSGFAIMMIMVSNYSARVDTRHAHRSLPCTLAIPARVSLTP